MLADTKLIAEPWDAAGLYQVGSFPFGRPLVASGTASTATTSAGSGAASRAWPRRWPRGSAAAPTSTSAAGRLPRHSINFITCHDGFTL